MIGSMKSVDSLLQVVSRKLQQNAPKAGSVMEGSFEVLMLELRDA